LITDILAAMAAGYGIGEILFLPMCIMPHLYSSRVAGYQASKITNLIY